MGIKAQATQANPGSRAAKAESPNPDAIPLGEEDALVMVLFPQAAWRAVTDLARELNVSPAETVGAALRLLRARVDEEAGRM